MERLAINERITAARERVEAEGRKWGRPPRLTDQDRTKVVALACQRRTIRQIAVALKIQKSTVARALKAAAAWDACSSWFQRVQAMAPPTGRPEISAVHLPAVIKKLPSRSAPRSRSHPRTRTSPGSTRFPARRSVVRY